ncbi:MAG: phosphoribosylformylglycinamidine cyclo-ligase [Saprospiraceae bacterium]|nr:phosphoribosylformylglycinamidine cyclo-ligase [Saprospiraceae bacterium]
MIDDRYAKRGVSSGKEEVHAAIQGLSQGLFPKAFCKILPDVAGGSEAHCNIMHADTAGTKTSLAYVYWKETGDLSVWDGIAQDALVMNLDDMACVGCTTGITISSTIGRNKHLIPGEVISRIIRWLEGFRETMSGYGVELYPAGGETADVGDIVRTMDVGYCTFARLARKDLLVNDIRPGQVIIGLASYGQATYETTYNSGIGSNGLTSARHDVLSGMYREKYPESFAPETDPDVVYSGQRKLTEQITIDGQSFSVGQLLLSPTRTYLPVISHLLTHARSGIHGLIHATGGGQTKVSKFITSGTVVKNNLMPVPPVFQMIRNESGTDWREMFQVFNMGQRLEIYADPSAADEILAIARSFGIAARIIGEVIPSEVIGVDIHHEGQIYHYR